VRERERLQQELVANCSHEFRTPLNIISGYTDLLLQEDFGTLPSTAQHPLQSIAEAARNLGDLVADFLKYAKAEAGTTPIASDRVEVATLGHEMERLAGVLLEDKQVTFSLDLAQAPPRLQTDGVKLRTILRNLVTNAAKFTPTGSITLRMALADGGLRIEVRDTGPGIRLEDQSVIFEPFRQLDGSSTRAHGGLGLGLALSRKLARLLGGDLTVESTPGHGAIFVLTLPTALAHDTDVRPQRSGADESRSDPAA
jgi:signal transduction histidine kinase